jgi:adenylate cyclase
VVLRPGAPKETTATLGHGEPIEIAPAGRLTVLNQGSERHVKLERLDWFSQAASARQLSTLPAFRREFSAEVLRPGTSLKVARVTLLFTDLTDSTKLYANIGDAAAFRLVQDHFVALLPIIEKNGGALVKTIGDAIMAVFAEEDGAVKAGVAMLEAFAAFRRDAPNGQATDIKIGLFTGPCFAINANAVLDYFGQSVNVAARLQGQAKSGEVVMESSAAQAAVQRGLLGRARVMSTEEASLKGVDGVIRIVRIAIG